MVKGFVKIYRTEFENPVLRRDSDTWLIWFYLKTYVTHTARSFNFKNQISALLPSQIIVSSYDLSKKLGIDRNKIDRVLQSFESHGFIKQETSKKNRLITLLEQQGEAETEKQDYNR